MIKKQFILACVTLVLQATILCVEEPGQKTLKKRKTSHEVVYQTTPNQELHYHIQRREIIAVREVLQAGADPNYSITLREDSPGKQPLSPLDRALMLYETYKHAHSLDTVEAYEHKEIVITLLEYGAYHLSLENRHFLLKHIVQDEFEQLVLNSTPENIAKSIRMFSHDRNLISTTNAFNYALGKAVIPLLTVMINTVCERFGMAGLYLSKELAQAVIRRNGFINFEHKEAYKLIVERLKCAWLEKLQPANNVTTTQDNTHSGMPICDLFGEDAQIIEDEQIAKTIALSMREFQQQQEQFIITQDEELALAEVQNIVQRGGHVDQRFEWERTGLHLAAIYNYPRVLESLLQQGAYIDARDRDGRTPYHVAVLYGNTQAAELLILQGADIDMRDDQNLSGEDILRSQGRLDTIHDPIAQLLCSIRESNARPRLVPNTPINSILASLSSSSRGFL